MIDLFKSARLRGVPIVAISTADQNATIDALVPVVRECTNDASVVFPMLQWDAARGLTPIGAPTEPVYKAGQAALQASKIKDSINFVDAMLAVQLLPNGAVVFVHNAHRQLHSQEPGSVAQNIQTVANVRDTFKQNFRMLVLLAPEFIAPPEIARDVITMRMPLPTKQQLETLVHEIAEGTKARLEQVDKKAAKAFIVPAGDALHRCGDALVGLAQFEAEQIAAMSMTETGVHIPSLWERKYARINETPGLSAPRDTITLDDLRGLESVKARVRQHRHAKMPTGVVAWIDEGADVFQNVEQDTSGTKTDQQRELLVRASRNNWRGFIFVGVPGTGKSAIASAIGNELGVPTIALDYGAMESKFVGESEANNRHALDVIEAVGEGHVFLVLTCNTLKGIRPQFQRRFKRGVFFFDLLTKEERDACWDLYLAKFDLDPTQPRPDDESWTGAEIRECCESAWDTGVSLVEAANFIIPVARSRATDIEAMRKEAHNRFLNASAPGEYRYDEKPMARQVRAVALGHIAPGSKVMN